MNNGLSDADIRQSRLLCYVAAAIFIACGLGLAFAPVEITPALRWVGVGFNGIFALSVALYGRQLGADS